MVRIDRGTDDGLALGMAVLGGGGVVGQIFRVMGDYADVLLLTDRNSSVDVIVQRSRARGVLVGAGRKNFNLRFKYLSHVEDVNTGDLVITSGLDRVFPEGLSVGYVTNVTRSTVGIFQEAEVQPTVDFAKISEVIVLLTQKRPAFPKLVKTDKNG
jgi:rod shape-determining protein MreC